MPIAGKGDSMQKNIILLTIDALRADYLGFMGYNDNISPNLDRIAKNSISFNQAISTAPGTRGSFSSLFTSTYPLMYGGYERLTKHKTPIAKILREKGYYTAGFHANAFLSRYYGYNRGFNKFEDYIDKRGERGKKSLKSKIKNTLKGVVSKNRFVYDRVKEIYNILTQSDISSAERINTDGLNLLHSVKSNSPLFLWLHYMDVHSPWIIPSDYRDIGSWKTQRLGARRKGFIQRGERISENDVEKLKLLYKNAISYADEKLGEFVKELNDLGLLDNSTLIITADHGESFLDHGKLGHPTQLYDEVLHVPLIIYDKQLEVKEVEDQVSMINLAPTIANLAGIKYSRFLGKSLLETDEEEYAISEVSHGKNQRIDLNKRLTSVRTKKWKYILNERDSREELYNLECDPKETENLIKTEKEKASTLRSVVEQHIKMEERENRKVERRYIRSVAQKVKNKVIYQQMKTQIRGL